MTTKDWFIDEECTTHLCGQRCPFIKYTAYPPNSKKIKGFNRVLSNAAGYGEVVLKSRSRMDRKIEYNLAACRAPTWFI